MLLYIWAKVLFFERTRWLFGQLFITQGNRNAVFTRLSCFGKFFSYGNWLLFHWVKTKTDTKSVKQLKHVESRCIRLKYKRIWIGRLWRWMILHNLLRVIIHGDGLWFITRHIIWIKFSCWLLVFMMKSVFIRVKLVPLASPLKVCDGIHHHVRLCGLFRFFTKILSEWCGWSYLQIGNHLHSLNP